MQRIANFANSAIATEEPDILWMSGSEYTFSVANEASADKIRWVCIAPYGDWPNKQGMQRITKGDATNIVNEFNSLMSTPKRLIGLPWYIGHPDHPAFANKYKDTKAYGRIKQLEARDDGLYAGVKMNDEGERLLTNEAYDGHSVNWYLKEDPKQKGFWRPFKVKSVGFTNEPNIPVPTMTTANENDANGQIFVIFANGSELQAAHFKKLADNRLLANALFTNGQGTLVKTVANERFRRIANFRIMANGGTSDGALTGWETRHGAAGAASAKADLATKRAEDETDPAKAAGLHNDAAQAHQIAAGHWAGLKSGVEKMEGHLKSAEGHLKSAAMASGRKENNAILTSDADSIAA